MSRLDHVYVYSHAGVSHTGSRNGCGGQYAGTGPQVVHNMDTRGPNVQVWQLTLVPEPIMLF